VTFAGWVEPLRNPSPAAFIIAAPRDGYRGVYHRARIRATRWLHPSYGLVARGGDKEDELCGITAERKI
jgi:hypothetical protein